MYRWLVCRKQTTKNLDPSSLGEKNSLFQVWAKSVGRRGQPLASYFDNGSPSSLGEKKSVVQVWAKNVGRRGQPLAS